jgi:hypothetical protein
MVMHAVVPEGWECDLPEDTAVHRYGEGECATAFVRSALSAGERDFLICADGLAAEPGWLLASDHIFLFGDSPLTGPNRDDLGERFPTLTGIYRTPGTGLASGVVCRVPDWRSATRAELDFTGVSAMVSGGVEEAVVAGHGGGRIVLLVRCHGFDGRVPGPSVPESLVQALATGEP